MSPDTMPKDRPQFKLTVTRPDEKLLFLDQTFFARGLDFPDALPGVESRTEEEGLFQRPRGGRLEHDWSSFEVYLTSGRYCQRVSGEVVGGSDSGKGIPRQVSRGPSEEGRFHLDSRGGELDAVYARGVEACRGSAEEVGQRGIGIKMGIIGRVGWREKRWRQDVRFRVVGKEDESTGLPNHCYDG